MSLVVLGDNSSERAERVLRGGAGEGASLFVQVLPSAL